MSRGCGAYRGGPQLRLCTKVELELILSHMTQKPMLRGEVGARALRVRSDVRAHFIGTLERKKPHVIRDTKRPPMGAPVAAVAVPRREIHVALRWL